MKTTLSNPNPYDVLGVSQAASNAEITKAFALAMKRREYSTEAIAKARKSLMNIQERLIVDYLRPLLPLVYLFKRQDFSALEAPAPLLDFLNEFDDLEAVTTDINQISEIDKRLGAVLFSSSPIQSPHQEVTLVGEVDEQPTKPSKIPATGSHLNSANFELEGVCYSNNCGQNDKSSSRSFTANVILPEKKKLGRKKRNFGIALVSLMLFGFFSVRVFTQSQRPSLSSSNSSSSLTQANSSRPSQVRTSIDKKSPESIAKDIISQSSLPFFKLGTLAESDLALTSNESLYDSYPLQGRAGQSLNIVVESQEFDTTLMIFDGEGNLVQENDDIDTNNTNSALTITLPNNDEYYIIVNAYDSQGSGDYNLTVRSQSVSPSQTYSFIKTQNNYNFPLSTCGDINPGGTNTWYPVYVDDTEENLRIIRTRYCRDAIRNYRETKGIHSIQVASFINSSEAYQFAEILRREIGSGEVGESSIH